MSKPHFIVGIKILFSLITITCFCIFFVYPFFLHLTARPVGHYKVLIYPHGIKENSESDGLFESESLCKSRVIQISKEKDRDLSDAAFVCLIPCDFEKRGPVGITVCKTDSITYGIMCKKGVCTEKSILFYSGKYDNLGYPVLIDPQNI